MRITDLTIAVIGSVLFASQSVQAEKMYGIDMSDVCTSYDCMKTGGISFAIPRGFQSKEGNWWPVKQNLQNARNAGLNFADVYFFPCREMNVKDQLNTFVSYMAAGRDHTVDRKTPAQPKAFSKGMDFLSWRQGNVRNTNDLYGMIWIDVELDEWHDGCDWKKFSPEENCQYIRDAVQAVKDAGRTPGIYTSPWEWSQVMGTQTYCQDLSYLPLWYNNYDGEDDFSDWQQIGGWTHPAIKQYNQNQKKCGLNIDPNVIVRNGNYENYEFVPEQKPHHQSINTDSEVIDENDQVEDFDETSHDHNDHKRHRHHHDHKRHHNHHHKNHDNKSFLE